ncbi:hypothetical protein K457DRAFT_1467585 [Linnemannia elongata AG-77]|uniref:Uncharacterized protein n=1 Tax=Linnemannia elongata AG-77 TaxID=1314771 RepID=A0A197JQV0_9FUNG|nr:hypothetical protein K457DRAFT_1467585 [Linnemannia elongata AG-77]
MNCQKGTSHLHKHRQPIQDQHCALDRHFLLGASVYPALFFLWFPQTLFHAIHPSYLHFSLLTLLPFFPPYVCLCACAFCLACSLILGRPCLCLISSGLWCGHCSSAMSLFDQDVHDSSTQPGWILFSIEATSNGRKNTGRPLGKEVAKEKKKKKGTSLNKFDARVGCVGYGACALSGCPLELFFVCLHFHVLFGHHP